jgi:hypothetical protein
MASFGSVAVTTSCPHGPDFGRASGYYRQRDTGYESDKIIDDILNYDIMLCVIYNRCFNFLELIFPSFFIAGANSVDDR